MNPLKVESQFPKTLWSSQTYVNPTGGGPLAWDACCGAQTTHSLGRNCIIFISLLLAGHHTEDMGPDKTTSLPFLSISVLLYLHCGMAVLLVFGSFSERVVLYVIVVLLCPWEDLFLHHHFKHDLWNLTHCIFNSSFPLTHTLNESSLQYLSNLHIPFNTVPSI